MIINEIDQELFREKAEPFFDSMPTWSPDLYETVVDLIEERPKENGS
ncbi:hypothetical protein [Bacillus sp. JCM 19041]